MAVGEVGSTSIANALKVNKCLRRLVLAGAAPLGGNGPNIPIIGDKGARLIVDTLAVNVALEDLVLSHNDFGELPGKGTTPPPPSLAGGTPLKECGLD
jgi:hypothetical protein